MVGQISRCLACAWSNSCPKLDLIIVELLVKTQESADIFVLTLAVYLFCLRQKVACLLRNRLELILPVFERKSYTTHSSMVQSLRHLRHRGGDITGALGAKAPSEM